MRPKLLSLLTFLFVLVLAAAPAEARRVALIIGNNNYSALSKLENPVPDAKAVASVLKAHGYEVFEHYDITRADLLDALESFKQAADQSSAALIYYAGHGMELAGKNVIAPTDMEVNCDNQQALRSVEAEKLFEALGAAPEQVVLFDACRNNPFPQCPKRSAISGSGFRGFTRIATPSRSLLIANATGSGQLAADGDPGSHSPFARALLTRLQASPKELLRNLLDDTSREVYQASNGAQEPEITTHGGSPTICLDEDGCGAGVAPPAVVGPVDDAMIGEVRALLGKLGYAVGSSRAGDPAFADAIRKFEASAGLPPDGQVSATLLAVLRASTRVASLGKPAGPGEVVPATPTEHAIGETFRDCTDNCPDMVAVQAGGFTMGAAANEPGRTPAEQPQHRVQIAHAFAMSKYEITFDDWDACALEGGCNGYMPKDGGWGRGKRPAIFVSWDDARPMSMAPAEDRQIVPAPTEAEWEYAARAGTTTPYATGATITTAQADFDASANGGKPGAYAGKTVDVGSFPPNPYGLFDMAGNVWEWVEDCWNPNQAGAPADGSARGGDCARRVLKGGAWYFEAAISAPPPAPATRRRHASTWWASASRGRWSKLPGGRASSPAITYPLAAYVGEWDARSGGRGRPPSHLAAHAASLQT